MSTAHDGRTYFHSDEAVNAELAVLRSELGCTRSHPHEDMGEVCKLKTEIARANNSNVHLWEVVERVRKYGEVLGRTGLLSLLPEVTDHVDANKKVGE